MSKTFINGLACISPQPTFSGDFSKIQWIDNSSDNILSAVEPPYKTYIPPAAIRRMGKGVKMAIVAATDALKQAHITAVEAILVGTGMGCLQDSEKFLTGLLDNNEQHLTPTAFIQSTHNTVAGQIALSMQCKEMNFTYVNGATSFESALLEAKMQMEQDLLQYLLVGGVDEYSPHTVHLYELAHIIKDKSELPQSLFHPTTRGIRLGEGASFFALSNHYSEETYAEVIDITLCNRLDYGEVQDFAYQFLKKNSLSGKDIGLIFSGRNENREDLPYFESFEQSFASTPTLAYKHLCGEYYTASAFGLWAACNTLKTRVIFPEMSLNNLPLKKTVKYVLLYNQYLGKDHSLVLLHNPFYNL